MSGTIEEIQERLSPDHLLHEAKSSLQEAAVDRMRRVSSVASSTAERLADTSRQSATRLGRYLETHPGPFLLAGAAGACLVAYRRRSSNRRHEGSMDNAGDRNQNVRGQRTGALARPRGTSQVQVTGSALQRWIQQNPLAVGAIALAAGAAVGLSLRRTEFEDAAVGEVRDSIVDRVADKARDIRDVVTENVQSVADRTLGNSDRANEGASSY